MNGLLRRAERRLRRVAATATAAARARDAGVRLGPENLCLKPVVMDEIVVDVGVGHTPTFSPWVREQTGAFVVLCDPTPKHAQRLRSWVSRTPRAALIECAVSPVDGNVEFFQSDAEESGSALGSHLNRRGTGRVYDVPGITLGTLLEKAREHGPVGLVKLDVEGVEFAVLDGSPSIALSIESVPQWLIEFHPYPQTSHTFSDIARIRRWFHARRYQSYTRNGIDYLFWR